MEICESHFENKFFEQINLIKLACGMAIEENCEAMANEAWKWWVEKDILHYEWYGIKEIFRFGGTNIWYLKRNLNPLEI